jgi:hypothetical protein
VKRGYMGGTWLTRGAEGGRLETYTECSVKKPLLKRKRVRPRSRWEYNKCNKMIVGKRGVRRGGGLNGPG